MANIEFRYKKNAKEEYKKGNKKHVADLKTLGFVNGEPIDLILV